MDRVQKKSEIISSIRVIADSYTNSDSRTVVLENIRSNFFKHQGMFWSEEVIEGKPCLLLSNDDVSYSKFVFVVNYELREHTNKNSTIIDANRTILGMNLKNIALMGVLKFLNSLNALNILFVNSEASKKLFLNKETFVSYKNLIPIFIDTVAVEDDFNFREKTFINISDSKILKTTSSLTAALLKKYAILNAIPFDCFYGCTRDDIKMYVKNPFEGDHKGAFVGLNLKSMDTDKEEVCKEDLANLATLIKSFDETLRLKEDKYKQNIIR